VARTEKSDLSIQFLNALTKSTHSAPLIRFRPWRYINLFTYLLTYGGSTWCWKLILTFSSTPFFVVCF